MKHVGQLKVKYIIRLTIYVPICMVFEGLRCGGPGHQRAARGTNRNDGWANRRPMPDWRIGSRQVSSRKGQGPARAGAFVRRITSAFIRSRRRPAFSALSLKKKGSGQIDRSEEHTSAH